VSALDVAVLLIVFGAIFVTLLLVGGRGAARWNGWTGLAERYPADGVIDGESRLFAGQMGNFVTSREPWMIRVCPMAKGLHLETQLPSTKAFPPMLVPWRAVEIRNRHLAAFNLITMYLGDERRELVLRGDSTLFDKVDKDFEAHLLALYDAGREPRSGTVSR
jgi:hypothetical protein